MCGRIMYHVKRFRFSVQLCVVITYIYVNVFLAGLSVISFTRVIKINQWQNKTKYFHEWAKNSS